MVRFGSILFIIGIILFIAFPIFSVLLDTPPNVSIIKSIIGITAAGGIILLIGVIMDRYKEHKEDLENDDYRKY